MATIEELRATDGIAKNWEYGTNLISGIRQSAAAHGLEDAVEVIGQEVRSVVTFPHVDEKEARVRRTYFMQECVKRGLLYFCAQLPCVAHGKAELDFTLGVINEVMPLFAEAIRSNDVSRHLEGPCVDAIFRKA